MEDWNDFKRMIREVAEPTPFKSAAQKRYKKLRKKNDIYSSPAGHKNLSSGSPFSGKTQRAGTDRLRFEEEVDPSSIDLSSFEIQDDLERNLWSAKDELKPLMREYMLKIALDFIESLDIPVKVTDIRLTGSIANFNWSKYSDVDLHIIVDFSDYGDEEELVRGYFDGKRIVWNNNHDIKLAGYDVELYVEGDDDVHISTGMYSVIHNKWLTKPTKEEKAIEYDLIRQKAAGLMDMIEAAQETLQRKDYKAAHLFSEKLKEKIRNMRKCGLEKAGAYSVENLSFKVLRRNGYLGMLSDVKNKAYDGLHTHDPQGGIVIKV